MFVWTISDVVGLTLFAVFAVAVIVIQIVTSIRQYLCKHDGTFGETGQCHAICHKCGKDLGFIGDWRKARAAAKGDV